MPFLNLSISISEQVWFLAPINSFQEAAPKFPCSSGCRPIPNTTVAPIRLSPVGAEVFFSAPFAPSLSLTQFSAQPLCGPAFSRVDK